jgi:hypothetical protein
MLGIGLAAWAHDAPAVPQRYLARTSRAHSPLSAARVPGCVRAQ